MWRGTRGDHLGLSDLRLSGSVIRVTRLPMRQAGLVKPLSETRHSGAAGRAMGTASSSSMFDSVLTKLFFKFGAEDFRQQSVPWAFPPLRER